MKAPPLRLVALEITRRCVLACRHCRGDSRDEFYSDELSLDEIRRILGGIAGFARPIIIITGGEPLTRPDVFDIASYSSAHGFRTVLATCGHTLDDVTVVKLLESGVSRISVSLDGGSAETHDGFRGVDGAFERALEGIEAARRHGLDFQINSTLTTLNIGELEALHDLAVEIGAVAFHPFLLVPMGRGRGLAEYALTGEEYEKALERIADTASTSPIEIKPTCSPHYARVIRQRASRSRPEEEAAAIDAGNPHVPAADTFRGRFAMTKGCLGGWSFAFVSHVGKVQMCGFLEIEAGDLRAEGYDFRRIWEESDFFREIRDLDSYHGKCGVCEYRRVCGGCRARAYYVNGDYLGEEPDCVYTPRAAERGDGHENHSSE